MKKEIDGINDEYETSEDLPLPQLDFDDTEFTEDEDCAFKNAFDIMEGSFDIFEAREENDAPTQETSDISQGKYEVFSLDDNTDNDVENAFDIISKENNFEQFPLVSGFEKDPVKSRGVSGDFIVQNKPVKPKNRVGVIAAITICSLLVSFLLWTVLGIVYTNKYNEYVYNEYLYGANIENINSDFNFFLTIDSKTFPVVKSDTAKHFTTLNGLFFMPGTLTCENDMTVRGSSRLLPSFEMSLIGKTLVVEKDLQKTEYEIYSVEEYTGKTEDGVFTVYTEHSASSTGYIAFFARHTKTASRL